ncbi:MAG: prepilin-type N-terminal cleavage/methylation domain-containing protein [Candidatus Portnoybacteria bacterium]|nr:prepilin-type N-terminal cleavage/methylation domain-containing protein [Candidatus Portnoybacteria bacterium]
MKKQNEKQKGFTPLGIFQESRGAVRNNQKPLTGFTLIELLTAVAVFLIVVLVITGIFSAAAKSQRKAFALQNVQETARYLLESMTKEIRMSTVNTADSGGLPLATLNVTNPSSCTFNYFFDGVSKSLWRAGYAVSPDSVEVEGSFYVSKSALPNTSRVTIFIKVRTRSSASAESYAEISAQSTVAAR